MKYCCDKKKQRQSAVICLAAVIGFDIFTVTVFMETGRKDPAFLLVFLWAIAIVSVATYAAFANYVICMRKYTVSAEGIEIAYPFCVSIFYSWDKVSDIGICKVHYPRRGPVRYEIVIRCVIGNEKRGPQYGYGNWTTQEYEAVHLRNVITIQFSANRLSEFEKLSPLGVNDYRSIKRYLYDPN